MWLTLALRHLSKNWKYYVPALLVSFQLFTIYEWSHTHQLLKTEQAAHKRDVQVFKDVQKTANDNALAIKAKLLKESKANAEQADAKYSSLLSQYRANLLRYKANQSNPSGPYNYQLHPTPSGDGPSESTNVSITLDDANICAVNTARLQAVHDWATTVARE